MEGVPLLNFSLSFIHRSGGSEPVPDLLHELVAHSTIGIEALLAIAFDRGRVRRRPVFHGRRHTITQSQRLMMRARRQRNDQIEIESFEIVVTGKVDRLVLGNVDADLVHDSYGKRVELTG